MRLFFGMLLLHLMPSIAFSAVSEEEFLRVESVGNMGALYSPTSPREPLYRQFDHMSKSPRSGPYKKPNENEDDCEISSVRSSDFKDKSPPPGDVAKDLWQGDVQQLKATHFQYSNADSLLKERGLYVLTGYAHLTAHLMSQEKLRPLTEWKSASSFTQEETSAWATALQAAL